MNLENIKLRKKPKITGFRKFEYFLLKFGRRVF